MCLLVIISYLRLAFLPDVFTRDYVTPPPRVNRLTLEGHPCFAHLPVLLTFVPFSFDVLNTRRPCCFAPKTERGFVAERHISRMRQEMQTEARSKIAGIALTAQPGWNWNSFQLASSTPPLNVPGSARFPWGACLAGEGRGSGNRGSPGLEANRHLKHEREKQKLKEYV